MQIRLIALLAGVLLLGTSSTALAAEAFKVKVRVEGKSKTLVPERKVTLADAPVIKDGNPDHACSGQSALGALQQGTFGKWTGSYSEGLGYFVRAIRGEKPTGNDFFQLWINHRESSVGFCDAKLVAGQTVLVFRQSCVFDPDTQKCPDEVTPLGLRIPTLIKKDRVRTLTVIDYKANGKSSPEPGATVYFNGKRQFKTDRNGQVRFKARTSGRAEVYAAKKGHVRTAVTTIHVK